MNQRQTARLLRQWAEEAAESARQMSGHWSYPAFEENAMRAKQWAERAEYLALRKISDDK